MEEKLLCPFRKRTVYDSCRNTGSGYPDAWIADEQFCECIKEKCAMYRDTPEFRLITGGGWCAMAK